MMLEEHAGKLLLEEHGLPVPRGRPVTSAQEAAEVGTMLGFPVMVKAQVPAGGRGKAGGVQKVGSAAEAGRVAATLLGSTLGGHPVERLLVEPCIDHDNEYYVAVLDDPLERSPVVLCSAAGGMDIEALERDQPGSVHRLVAGLDRGLAATDVDALVARAGIRSEHVPAVSRAIGALWECYGATDAELVEVNPLVVDAAGSLWGLDAKVALDEAALPRHEALRDLVTGTPDATGAGSLEAEARDKGLLFIELDGDVGIVANGAGLTMATLDVVTHYGGRPANFMEVGGDNYTKARTGVEVVLSNPRVRSLLVNFCGAFARTDVMAEGVVQALESRPHTVPVFFSIHGTGEEEAIALVKQRLGATPYPNMDDAVRAAVDAARTSTKGGVE